MPRTNSAVYRGKSTPAEHTGAPQLDLGQNVECKLPFKWRRAATQVTTNDQFWRSTMRVDPEKTHLSRRSFLVHLTFLGVSTATAMSLGVDGATAAPEGETVNRAKGLANEVEGKKAEVVQQVDPNDPLQHFNQPYYRHRRRVARRHYRRGRRYARRTYRRVRRRSYYYY